MENKLLTLSDVPYVEQPGFKRTYKAGRLTLGIFYPLEAYSGDAPTMKEHLEIAQMGETAGFAALWVRDVPLRDPHFGDIGQIYDPWVYLGYLAAGTSTIALGTGAIVLPIRHPLHVAKSAASVDQLSDGRLLLGLASGDRPAEFPAFGKEIHLRGELFREYIEVIKSVTKTSFEPVTWVEGYINEQIWYPNLIPKRSPSLLPGQASSL